MMHAPKVHSWPGRVRPLCGLGVAAIIAGCSSTQTGGTANAVPTRPAQVSPLELSAYPDPVDRDRLALSRFVGAWDYEGWYDPPGEARRETAGIAAGTIEHEYFLLLDSAQRVEQAGVVEFITGSILLSVEPGIGLMLTAWSAESASVHRFRGRVEADGSRFVFDEIRPLQKSDRLRMVMRFETDDRWVAEFMRKSAGHHVIAASYTFTRVR